MEKLVDLFEDEIKQGEFIILKCKDDSQCYKTYLSKSLQLRNIIIKYEHLFDREYLKVFSRLRESITRAWRIYEKGDIRSAGNIIYNLLFSNKYLNHLLSNEFESEEIVDYLYRGRIIDYYNKIETIDNFRKEIFHIPFDKRNLVANERYSISGFPCLYLSSSVFGVKAELDIIDDSKNLFIGDFKVKHTFKYFDLTPSFLKDIREMTLIELKLAMLKLLLVMVCSIHVDKGKNNYCSNYVIPQLVTASIASKAKYSYRCIKYLSLKSYFNKRIDYNYVFIPEYQKEFTHDTKLMSFFDIEPNKNYSIFKHEEVLVMSQ